MNDNVVVPFRGRGGNGQRPPGGGAGGGGARPGVAQHIVEVKLPELHADQVNAFWRPGRLRALRAGRRWGKTTFDCVLAADFVAKGANVGWFAPNYKYLMESFRDVEEILEPILTESNRSAPLMRARTDGRVDFWSLEDDRAGRGRKYHLVIADEAAFTKPNAIDTWERAIRPTLVDYRGAALVSSNTNGVNPENFFWQVCCNPKYGFVEYHAPSRANPYLPQEELDEIQARVHPLVWMQEYEAEFVDFRGIAFFSLSKWMEDDQPVPSPEIVDTIFVTLDTAIKSGSEHDGTGVIYWGLSNVPEPHLFILDYDIISINGSLLVEWLPSVFQRLEQLARTMKVRFGWGQVYIEDKGSGTILLQAGEARGWPVVAIESELTAKGKDERAMAVNGAHYSGQCKITQYAYDKVVMFHEHEVNHLVTQVTSFRIGDKEAYKRADDLLDCYTYGLAIGLGNWKGF
jgi:hypothetical protein